MCNPVYALEWQRTARRARKYPWRRVYAGLLLVESLWLTIGILDLFLSKFLAMPIAIANTFGVGGPERLAEIAGTLLRLIVAQQAVAILIAASAFASGSITDEKRRGTLEFLLMSPLASAEIVLGKWLGQATQVLHLISPGYFMLFLLAGTVGVPVGPVLIAIVQQIVLIYTVTGLSLLASTWSRSTPKAIVSVYAFLGALVGADWLCGVPVLDAALWTDPLGNAVAGNRHVAGMMGFAALTFVAVGLTIWRLRPAHEHQTAAPTRVLGRWWDRPPIGDAPMRWKERFIGDWLSVPIWRLLPRWQKCLLVACLTGSIALALPALETFVVLGIVQLLASGLFVAIRAAGAVTGEREHQTWDSLLTTHMDSYQIVRGKLWGQIDAIRPYLLAYLAPALVGALCTDWLAGVWILYTWLASWAFLYYLGAAGISQSLKAASTWRSILITLTFGSYSGRLTVLFLGFLLGSVATVFLVAGLALSLGDALMLAAMGAGLPCFVLIFAGAEEVLLEAQQELKRQTDFGRPTRRRRTQPSARAGQPW